MPRYTDAEIERHERFRRYTTASAEIAHRAHREAQRAGAADSGAFEATTSDWILAIMLDPEILGYFMSEGEIDIGAVRRRRAPTDRAAEMRSQVATDETSRSPIIATSAPALHGVFESLMRWALSDEPDAEVQKWRPHSDLQMYLSTMPPDAEDDPWSQERVRARVYRFAVLRKMFELLRDHEREAVRTALDDLQVTELQFQRCLDRLATKYTLEFTYRSDD